MAQLARAADYIERTSVEDKNPPTNVLESDGEATVMLELFWNVEYPIYCHRPQLLSGLEW